MGPAWPLYRAGSRPAAFRRRGRSWLRACLIAFLLLGQDAAGQPTAEEPISPLSPITGLRAPTIALGQTLFGDVILSGDRTVACASCHRLGEGGDDGRARSVAADGGTTDFNAPTVFNAAFNFRLNWRGNFRTIEEQNEAVLLDPSLMNARWEDLLSRLGNDPAYARRFSMVYGSPPNRENVLDALATFQRSLVTLDSRFDRYLKGEDVIAPDEEHGYRLFKEYGCAACHQGANVGGNLFQKFGVFADPFADRDDSRQGDLGRFTVTGREQDRHVFRVPSLRNVALTAPYFHDGRTASLELAVKTMARTQLGREIPVADVRAIVAFLRTLTGEYRGRPLTNDGDQP